MNARVHSSIVETDVRAYSSHAFASAGEQTTNEAHEQHALSCARASEEDMNLTHMGGRRTARIYTAAQVRTLKGTPVLNEKNGTARA